METLRSLHTGLQRCGILLCCTHSPPPCFASSRALTVVARAAHSIPPRGCRWLRRIQTEPKAQALFRRFGGTHSPRTGPAAATVELQQRELDAPAGKHDQTKPAAGAREGGAAFSPLGRSRSAGPKQEGRSAAPRSAEPPQKKQRGGSAGAAARGGPGPAAPARGAKTGRASGGSSDAPAPGGGGPPDDDWSAIEVAALRWRVTLHGEGSWDAITEDYRLRNRRVPRGAPHNQTCSKPLLPHAALRPPPRVDPMPPRSPRRRRSPDEIAQKWLRIREADARIAEWAPASANPIGAKARGGRGPLLRCSCVKPLSAGLHAGRRLRLLGPLTGGVQSIPPSHRR